VDSRTARDPPSPSLPGDEGGSDVILEAAGQNLLVPGEIQGCRRPTDQPDL